MNSQKDTEFFDDSYYCLLNYLSHYLTNDIFRFITIFKDRNNFSLYYCLIIDLSSAKSERLLICLIRILTHHNKLLPRFILQ